MDTLAERLARILRHCMAKEIEPMDAKVTLFSLDPLNPPIATGKTYVEARLAQLDIRIKNLTKILDDEYEKSKKSPVE